MRVVGSLSLSLFLFSLPSVSTSSFSILFVFCAAAFSLVCTDLCSGMYSNEGSVIRTSFWCTSQSAPRLRASASKCKACSLLHYCTCYFILLLYNIYSETWVTLQIEIIACWLAVTSTAINQMVLWAGHSERMLPHILRLTTKRNKKTLKLIIGNILDIDQCVHRSVPNNQDDSWSMLPESEVYKHIIRLSHLYNLKQTSASALQRVMDNFY